MRAMRTRGSSKRRGAGLSIVAALALAPSVARADGSIAVDRLHPAPAGDRMFGVPSPFAADDPAWHAMVLASYAHEPLVFRRKSDGESVGVVVSGQLFAHLNLTYAPLRRVSLNVDLPIALYQAGDDPDVPGVGVIASPSGADVGDARFGARVRLFGEHDDALQIAVGGYVWVPIGARDADASSYVSERAIRGLPQLIAGGRTSRVVWSAAAGVEIRPSRTFGSVAQGPSISGGLGVGVLVDGARRAQLGAEISASTVLQEPGKRTTNAELLVDARYRFLGALEIGVGVGPGLTSGVGTPDVRVVGMIAYTPEQGKPAPTAERRLPSW